MNYLCDSDKCTACGACIEVCPSKCIEFRENEFGEKKAYVHSENCIDCKQCARACHITNKQLTYKKAGHVFAAWSADNDIRTNGASGGLASQIYKYAIEKKISVMGTKFTRDEGVVFKEVCRDTDIEWVRDSKYVYSCMLNAFKFYEDRAKSNKRCIFIGLPCQVAAIRTYLESKRISTENCLFVDIICHGVPPYKFLNEHISKWEKVTGNNIKKVTFRYKSNYLLQYYTEEDSCVYKKNMNEDVYFRAFIESLDYRENCYNCHYSKEERVSDLTLGDYSGLGKAAEWEHEVEMVSLILCNTEKGKTFVEELIDGHYIVAFTRPDEEPFLDKVGNPQLHHPSEPHVLRSRFIEEYNSGKNFDDAALNVLRNELIRYYLRKPIVSLKRFAVGFLSKEQKKKIKKLLRIQ